MTIQRELKLDHPTIEIKVVATGRDERKLLTWIVDIEQIKDKPDDELVTWMITLPNMTPDQMRCLGEQFVLAAGLAEDDRAKLERDKDFTIQLPKVASG